jgi:antitoxin component YwqK of YwqJK toxin-antitoxin module
MTTDRDRRDLRGRVKSVRAQTFEFEKQGAQFKEKPWLVRTETFDAQGRLSEESFDNAQHPEYSNKHTLAYDSTGRLYEEFYSEGRGLSRRTLCLYDSQNRLVQQVSLDGDGKAAGRSDVLYDAHGNKVEKSSYDAGGKLVAKTEFTYHPNGNRAEESSFDYEEPEPNAGRGYTIDANSGYDHLFLVTGRAFLERKLYDLNGNPAQLQLFDKSGNLLTRVIFTTDAASRIVKDAHFGGGGCCSGIPAGVELPPEIADLMSGEIPVSESEIVYDAEGRKIEDRMLFRGALSQARAFKYDSHGELIEESTFKANGALQSRAQIKREYDSQGNWIEELVSSWNDKTGTFEPSLVERREIKYHD